MAAIENRFRLPDKPRVFYGYWVVAATFLCLFITSGCGFFAFSLFVRPLQADLGWGRGGIMTAFTIYLLVSGLTSPFSGRLIDRYEARKVMTAGAVLLGLGFSSLSQMGSLWHYYLSYGIIGVGAATMGHVPSSAVISNWFERRRGTAIGVMSAGIGAGGFVMAPIVGGYLIPELGWRTAYLVLGVLAWVLIIPLALFVIKTRPADKGLYPDGRQAPEAAAMAAPSSTSAANGPTLKMALATSTFWLIAVGFLTGNFSQVGILQSQVPHLEDIGFPAAVAAGALGGVGLGSLIGKFVFGWLCDRIPAKYAYSIGLALQVVSITILLSIRPASPLIMVWLYVAVVGLSAGAWLPTMSMIVSSNFGLGAYGAIFGVVTLFQSIGVATGPVVAGYMFDTMDSYRWAFLIFLALHVVAVPAVLATRRPKSF